MFQKVEHRKQQESFSLVELVNFLGHAAYRAAVITQYPDEYNRIVRLEDEVTHELETLSLSLIDFVQQGLTSIFVDAIVYEFSLEEIQDQIADVIFRHYPDDMLEDTDFKSELDNEVRAVLNITKKIHHRNLNWRTDIYHRCRPSELICDANFLDVVHYVDTKSYRYEEELVEDVLQISTSAPPFRLITMYRNRPKYVIQSKQTDQLPIPEASLFNRYVKAEQPKDVLKCNETQFKAMCHLRFFDNETTHVEFINSLNIQVDLSSPMSKQEIELLMSDLYNRILHYQNSNRNAALLLSEELGQLEKAYRDSSDIGNFDLCNHMQLTKYPLKGVDSFADVKRALLGLMAWFEHFTKSGEGNSIKYEKSTDGQARSFEKVVEQFKAHNQWVKRGFGINSITKGYSIISVAIQQELTLQRRGRYQARKISIQRMRALRVAPTYPLSELHENDLPILQARLENLSQRGVTGIIKQHQDGSIWVIPT